MKVSRPVSERTSLGWKSRFREGLSCLKREVNHMGVIGKGEPSEVTGKKCW